MKQKISLFPLILLIISALDSIRTLPTNALFGPSLIFFFFLSSLIFLIPVALISSEFASRYPDQGGVFYWIEHAFGEKVGALSIWLQWINTMVWYPTALLFLAGTIAHLFHPDLAKNPFFLSSAAISSYWFLTLLNLKGIQVSAKTCAICGTIGTLLPMVLLIALGAWWMASGYPTAIAPLQILPSLELSDHGTAIVTIMASFVGIELAGVYTKDIEDPRKNFPKAVGISVLILITLVVCASLSICLVIPKSEIHFVDGIMQTFFAFFNAFDLPFLTPILALLILIGTAGSSVNWVLSPALGLSQIAARSFLPPYFLAENKSGVPVRILIGQGIVVSLFCVTIQFIPRINLFYWFLMSLSTIIYMLMYILLFLAAIKLGRSKNGYQIPLGMRKLACLAGIFGCLLTITLGFQPSPQLSIENKMGYASLIGIGLIVLISPILFLWSYQKKQKSLQETVDPTASFKINS